jgi:hypothetical protein
MRLITKPEELVVGRSYAHLRKTLGAANVFLDTFNEGEDAEDILSLFYVIECLTPTAADFDKLIKEQE